MNSIVVSGNVGNKQELRNTPSGSTVISFSLADNRGKDQEPIWWHVTFWGKQAQTIDTYVTKGQFLVVSGEFVGNKKWTTNEGEERDSLEINGRQFQFGPRTDAAQAQHSSDFTLDEVDSIPW